jgi:hypothetical protein
MPEPPEHAGPSQLALGLLMALLPELELEKEARRALFIPAAPGFLAAAHSAICVALPLRRVEFASAARSKQVDTLEVAQAARPTSKVRPRRRSLYLT